jgi:hypothetical protein
VPDNSEGHGDFENEDDDDDDDEDTFEDADYHEDAVDEEPVQQSGYVSSMFENLASFVNTSTSRRPDPVSSTTQPVPSAQPVSSAQPAPSALAVPSERVQRLPRPPQPVPSGQHAPQRPMSSLAREAQKNPKDDRNNDKKRSSDQVDVVHLNVAPKLQLVKANDPKVQWQQLPSHIQNHILFLCPSNYDTQCMLMYKYLHGLFHLLPYERKKDVEGHSVLEQFDATKRNILEMLVADGNSQEHARQMLNGFLCDTAFSDTSRAT